MAAVNKTLKDGAGADFNVQIQDTLGRQAAAESPSHALSTEDAAVQAAIQTAVEAIQAVAEDTTTPTAVKPDSTAHALIPAPSTYLLPSSLASTNAASVKTSLGTVKGIHGYNAKASAVYLRLYNKSSPPTVGTDTPRKVIYLPASAAFSFDFGAGIGFTTGIGIAITGANGLLDATAIAAGDVLSLNVDYN